MSDAGLYAPVQWFDYGNPDDPSSPEIRSALQEEYATLTEAGTTNPGYISPGFHGFRDPIAGWTVQNATPATADPFRPPLDTNLVYGYAGMGHIPDWTGDADSIAAGRYDQNPVWRDFIPNRINQGPIGSILFDGYSDSGDRNPSAPNTDVSGQLGGDLEY